jgi:hypothetical protein
MPAAKEQAAVRHLTEDAAHGKVSATDAGPHSGYSGEWATA